MKNENTAPRVAWRVPELARACGVHEKTIRVWVANGDLKATRVAGTILIPIDEVDRLLHGRVA